MQQQPHAAEWGLKNPNSHLNWGIQEHNQPEINQTHPLHAPLP